MAEMKVKELYMGKSIEELKHRCDILKILKGRKPKQLIESANKLLKEAERYKLLGDEELSYINYMKYLEIVTYVQKDSDYVKEKSFYSEMLGNKNVTNALSITEDLSKSLEQRYLNRDGSKLSQSK